MARPQTTGTNNMTIYDSGIHKINHLAFGEVAAKFGTILGRTNTGADGSCVFVVETPSFGENRDEPYAALLFHQDPICYAKGVIGFRSPVELANKIADLDELAFRGRTLADLRYACVDAGLDFPEGLAPDTDEGHADEPQPIIEAEFASNRTGISMFMSSPFDTPAGKYRTLTITGPDTQISDTYKANTGRAVV